METVVRNTITTPQIKKIFAIANKKQISNENLHCMVYEWFKVEHIRELTKFQGIRLINQLEPKPQWRKKYRTFKHNQTTTTYSPGQKWKILHQMEEIKELGYGYTLSSLSERILGKDISKEWNLTYQEAKKLISGLGNIIRGLK